MDSAKVVCICCSARERLIQGVLQGDGAIALRLLVFRLGLAWPSAQQW